jgi:hypothetical protein
MFNKLMAISILLIISTLSIPARAASEDECSIWLCLPGGFPSGCSAALSAMKDRIKHRKSPLPDFEECAVNPPEGSGSHMTYAFGQAAYVPEHQECTQWSGGDTDYCWQWETIPETNVKGVSCSSDDSGIFYPPFCTHTRSWAEVYADGVPVAPAYYW